MDDQRLGRPVVAGVDGSESALQAVRWAAREAARQRAPLRLVTAVASAPAAHRFAYSPAGPDPKQVLLRQAEMYLTHAAAEAVDAAPGTVPKREVLDGFPIPRLLDESRSARLVVIGNRGLGGVVGLLLGSVAFALGAHGVCPAVVVRGRTNATGGPVVVGVDGSPISEAALAFAFEAAALRRAPLLAVHAWWSVLLGTLPPSQSWDEVQEEEQAVLAERLAGWRQKYPDVEVERRVTWDLAAEALVAHSQRAQLIVVGSHGRLMTALVLGSVSHAVLHRADCPVVIVRPDTGSGGVTSSGSGTRTGAARSWSP